MKTTLSTKVANWKDRTVSYWKHKPVRIWKHNNYHFVKYIQQWFFREPMPGAMTVASSKTQRNWKCSVQPKLVICGKNINYSHVLLFIVITYYLTYSYCLVALLFKNTYILHSFWKRENPEIPGFEQWKPKRNRLDYS